MRLRSVVAGNLALIVTLAGELIGENTWLVSLVRARSGNRFDGLKSVYILVSLIPRVRQYRLPSPMRLDAFVEVL